MDKPRSGTNEEIKAALEVCSTWVYDGHGDVRKDCISCPYQDPGDPAGMNCGERLMRDARSRIKELEEHARLLEGGTRE